MSSIQNDIQSLVLEFFDTIGSNMSGGDNGAYRITIPEKYRNLFHTSELCIAFDKETSSKCDCELVISGSRILSLIIDVCTNKGPVALKLRTGNGGAKIRYYFLIIFSGRSRTMMMDHADIDLNIAVPKDINGTSVGDFPLNWIAPSKITFTYTTALKEMKKKHSNARDTFLDDANNMFLHELEMLVDKHDSHLRELDHSINYRERKSSDQAKSREFRFQTANRIDDLEKEKVRLVDALQQKHLVVLEYRLVACEVIVG